MTPDQARRLLDGTTPGPWEWADGKDNDVEYEALRGPGGVNALRTQDAEEYASWIVGTNANKALAAAAPTLAAMVAEMRTEYAVRLPDGQIVGAGWGNYDTALEDQNAWRRDGYDARIVRHYVTPEEEIK